MPSRRSLAVGVAVGLVAVLMSPVATGAQDIPSSVRIIHAYDAGGNGVGSTPVSVCADDDLLDADFTVGEALGPIDLAPGPVQVRVYSVPIEDCEAGNPFFDEIVEIPSGETLSVVAASDVDGEFLLDIYEDNTDCVDEGAGRVVARHAASQLATGTPGSTVSIVALGAVLVPELSAGEEFMADVPAGTYDVSVTAPGTTEPALLGPLALDVLAAEVLEVYAIGAEGPLGAFTLTNALEVCATPETTTTTIVTATTTPPAPTPPPAAAPVRTEPRFTG